MTININRLELKARDKTDVLIILEDEEKGYVEETLTVYHKLLFNDELVKELLAAEHTEGAELPLVTRHLLLIDAQCMKTTDEAGKWAKWTPEALAVLGVPLQTEIHRQIFNPLFEVLRGARPVPAVVAPASTDAETEESEEVLQL